MNLDTTFCMESGQVRTGEDKDDTFVKMLQEVHHVTPPIAYGIASEYPNIISLVKAFQKHGPLILKDLQVYLLPLKPLLRRCADRVYLRNLRTGTALSQTARLALVLADGCIKYSRSWILLPRMCESIV